MQHDGGPSFSLVLRFVVIPIVVGAYNKPDHYLAFFLQSQQILCHCTFDCVQLEEE